MTSTSRLAVQAARRKEIIAAARSCFLSAGFHGATMTQISRQSGYSAGQIYRYFKNKEAIIAEFVLCMTARRVCVIFSEATSPTALQNLLIQHAVSWFGQPPEDRALQREIIAEASRNPAIQKMLQQANALSYSQALTHMQRLYPEWDEQKLAARFEFVAALMDGLSSRIPGDEEQDMHAVHKVYTNLFALLFNEAVQPTSR
ncbi:TetR/AcrR family transcriptional regulator [Entomohabitans teleogrylli]|uniref:TetR/AcrR family transcriptional regulator n=1 Tax=Entomohabitans teleogrylli TaxID=1384589 RepID=UPI00073D4C16|nr:TetR/AcrR family transcriptional regulator [Entomohabitans teleogrylli]